MNLKKNEEGQMGGFKGGKAKMLELNYSLKNKKKSKKKMNWVEEILTNEGNSVLFIVTEDQ